MYNFQVYNGYVMRDRRVVATIEEAKTSYKVVMQFMQNLQGRSYVVCIDNYFTSMKLLMDLQSVSTFGIGIVRSNHLGLLKAVLD